MSAPEELAADRADASKWPFPTLTINFKNTSKVEHAWHIFTQPPEISGAMEEIWIQSIAEQKVAPGGSANFVVARPTYTMCSGGNPWAPHFPDFYGPITLATDSSPGTRIKMTVNKGRAQFVPPEELKTTSAGACTVRTDDSFDQGSGYCVGIALPDIYKGKITVAAVQANPMADIQIHQITHLWMCWGDFQPGPKKVNDVVSIGTVKGGVVVRLPYSGGETSINVNYMPNGHYTDAKGNRYDELPRAE